jgi:hypothetical protein
MRVLRSVLPLVLVGAAAMLRPQEAHQDAHQTDAQQDGLNGPVRTVSMHPEQTNLKLEGAQAWVGQFAQTGDTEYDRDGNRTKAGQPSGPNGEFQGQVMQFVRDGNGHVIERTVSLVPLDQNVEHDFYGPFGLVHSSNFANSKPFHQRTISYDAHGNVLEDVSLDGDRKAIFRTLYRRRPDGQWTERTMWLNGALHSHESYDPDSDFQRYEEYDQSGAIVVTFTYHNNRVESYWSAWEDPNAGTTVLGKLDNGDSQTSTCHRGGTCTETSRHTVYLDKARHNPAMMEVRSFGKVVGRAYAEYQIDDHENWTSRKVWVQQEGQGERSLYETDTRTITYWPE